jgi:hypothetical protein
MQVGSFCTHPQGVRQRLQGKLIFLILESINNGSFLASQTAILKYRVLFIIRNLGNIGGMDEEHLQYSQGRARFFGFSKAVS